MGSFKDIDEMVSLSYLKSFYDPPPHFTKIQFKQLSMVIMAFF